MAAPAGAVMAAPRQPTVTQPAVDDPDSLADLQTVGGIQTRLQSERAVLDDLMATMLVEDRLYEQLAELQFERVVHRSQMDERVSDQHRALGDLSREYYSMQHEPERLADFVYEIERSMRTVDYLYNTTVEERELVDDLRELVEAENETLAELDTPLADALAAQRASQLRGLDYVSEQLAVQEEALVRAKQHQEDRLEYVQHYEDIWREIETVERNRVLDRLEKEYDETHRHTTIQGSRFQGERYVVSLLREHHHARMETVVEYTSLLWSVEDDLATLGETPTAAEVEALQAKLDDRAAELSTVRDALATESSVVNVLREEMAAHEDVLEDRRWLLWEQTALADRLEDQSRVETQNRSVTTLERHVEEELALLERLGERLDAEQRVVTELYEVGDTLDTTGRLAAYLRVRDDVADLLMANLERQEALVEEQSADLVSKRRAVLRLGYARGVQDLWRRLPAFNESVRLDRLDAEVLYHRFEGQQEAFGLLTDLRREADETFEGEQKLLLAVRDDLDRVETATSATGNGTEATGNGSAVPIEAVGDGAITDSDGEDGTAGEPSAPVDDGKASVDDANDSAQVVSAGQNAGGGLASLALVVLLLVVSCVAIAWMIRVDYRRLSRQGPPPRDEFE